MREQPIETLNYKGYTIEVYPDYNAENPREWDNLGTIAYWSRDYILGDEDGKQKYGFPGNEAFWEYWNEKDIFWLPVFKYEHSGITIKTKPFSCPWDSGQLGYIYVTKAKVREEFGVKRISKKLRDKVYNILRGEIETFDDYVSGDVFGYEVPEFSHNVINSCWGFYGTDFKNNGLLEHAQDDIECELGEIEKINLQRKHDRFKKLKEFIKSKVPFQYRKLPEMSV